MDSGCIGALVAGLMFGLAIGLVWVAGFLNNPTHVQWRFGPIWYRRAGSLRLLELGGLKLGAIGWKWRRLGDESTEPEAG